MSNSAPVAPVLSQTLNQIALLPYSRTRLLLEAFPQYSGLCGREGREWTELMAKETTVAQIIEALGPSFRLTPPANPRARSVIPESTALKQFKLLLAKEGLTVFDWPRLAPTAEMMASHILSQAAKDRRVLLETSIMFLPLSSAAFARIEYALQRAREEITIAQFIAMSQDIWGRQYEGHLAAGIKMRGFHNPKVSDVSFSIRSVRKTLRSLGLTGEDGIFLREYSQETYLREIADDLNVDLREARRIFDYFRGKGWDPRLEQ